MYDEEGKTFCGLPIEEAIKIIEMYKYARDSRTSSYLQGFESGYRAAYEDAIQRVIPKEDYKE